jgi:hypothetical protein
VPKGLFIPALSYAFAHPGPGQSVPKGLTIGNIEAGQVKLPDIRGRSITYRVTIPVNVGITDNIVIDYVPAVNGRTGMTRTYQKRRRPVPAAYGGSALEHGDRPSAHLLICSVALFVALHSASTVPVCEVSLCAGALDCPLGSADERGTFEGLVWSIVGSSRGPSGRGRRMRDIADAADVPFGTLRSLRGRRRRRQRCWNTIANRVFSVDPMVLP